MKHERNEECKTKDGYRKLVNTIELSRIFGLILARNQSAIEASYDGVEQSDSLLQLPGRSNCMNWILGHIAVYRDVMLLSIGKKPYLGKRERTLYGYGSDPIYEEGTCVDIRRLTEVLYGGHAMLSKWLSAGGNDFNVETPGGLYVRKGDTIGEHFAHLFAHEATHAGELGSLREVALVRMGKGWK